MNKPRFSIEYIPSGSKIIEAEAFLPIFKGDGSWGSWRRSYITKEIQKALDSGHKSITVRVNRTNKED